MEPLRHLPDVLHSLNERPRQSHAFNYMKDGVWFHLSTEQVVNYSYGLALYLKKKGLQKGDRIGIYAKSSPYWSIIDFAITLAGGITVPYYSNLSERHFLYETRQTNPKWLFVGDQEDLENIKDHQHFFEATIGIEEGAYQQTGLVLFEWIEKGLKILKNAPYEIEILKQAVQPDDVATIIYSSGSTGNPKGVELTHKNLVSFIHQDIFFLRSYDKYLSVLPLAHIFSKQIHLNMTAWGIPVYFLNDLKKISQVTCEIPITRMITVPRILEKAYSKIVDNIKSCHPIKRWIGEWALWVAHRKKDWMQQILHPIADKLVFCKIRNAFGSNFHSILSGGAALNPHLHSFFLNVGIPIIQGWGLTEASCIAVNRLNQNKIGTVGPPLAGVKFKISEEGEVLVHSPSVMKGYYKNTSATQCAIDPQGWLYTGDYGYLDSDGHLVILGRINESFKTSQGEYVNPLSIEQQITESPLIDTAMVVGENRPYPTILLFPDFDAIGHLMKQRSLDMDSPEEFLRSPQVEKETQLLIEEVNKSLDHWQKIRSYRFIWNRPSIEGGELTPTLKLRRKIIIEKYASIIDEMYGKHPQLLPKTPVSS